MMAKDTDFPPGRRRILKNSMNNLKGFEWNSNRHLFNFMVVDHEATINEETGEMQIWVESFSPDYSLEKVQGTTHVRLVMAGVCWEEESDQVNACHDSSGHLPINNEQTGEFILNGIVKPYPNGRMLLGLGIEYSQEVNEEFYPMKGGSSFRIVQVR